MGSIDAKFSLRTPIIGLTGALGSGCTWIAKLLEEFCDYKSYSLSDVIKEQLLAEGITNPTTKQKQDKGDELRRNYKNDCLVGETFKKYQSDADSGALEKFKGVVFDGIRNVAEINALRPLPFFFLISVQAPPEVRAERLIEDGKCKDKSDFDLLDQRDADGHSDCGQQVNACNHLADIIVVNQKHVVRTATGQRREAINNLVQDPYLYHINALAKGEVLTERCPKNDEAMMTAAYVESRRSRCLKRKVGAVIATAQGVIVSCGYNDVPIGLDPCIHTKEYQGCARDYAITAVGKRIKFCPNCGTALDLCSKCVHCGTEISGYTRACPNPKCKKDPEIAYSCSNCHQDVLSLVLAGKAKNSGKMLDVCRSLHAEENAIISLGMSTHVKREDLTLYTTAYPCNLCANKIAMAGIKRVVFAEPYLTKEAGHILETNKIEVKRFSGVKSEAFFRFFG